MRPGAIDSRRIKKPLDLEVNVREPGSMLRLRAEIFSVCGDRDRRPHGKLNETGRPPVRPARFLAVPGALLALIAIGAGCRSLDPRRPFADAAATESPRLRFDSKVPARVEPNSVSGEVFFKVFRTPAGQRGKRPLDVCVLQHGFGVGQTLLTFKSLTYDAFVSTYYGGGTVTALLRSTCDSVFVPMQESNRTSILEMTERTEVFLREIACPARPKKALRCAYVGHSKGGAVAFNIARRCMQKRSLLGSDGCSRIHKIYSATGVIQGALGALVVHGAALLRNSEHQQLFASLLGWGMNLVWDVYEPHVPGKSNPVWLDLSPLAPMEDGVPLYKANSVTLTRSGWLAADFAASGVDFRFNDDGSSILHGCGQAGQSSVLNARSCQAFGVAVGRLHSAALRPSFEAGLRDLTARAPTTPDSGPFIQSLNWNEYQQGDGLADLKLSLSACRKGLLVKPALRAVRSCTIFGGLNHLATAGGGPEALADLIKHLGE